eukprot:SM000194S04813  [mRNA]  locus=s194:25596:26246:+ [translate_table: standard]
MVKPLVLRQCDPARLLPPPETGKNQKRRPDSYSVSLLPKLTLTSLRAPSLNTHSIPSRAKGGVGSSRLACLEGAVERVESGEPGCGLPRVTLHGHTESTGLQLNALLVHKDVLHAAVYAIHQRVGHDRSRRQRLPSCQL